MRKLMEAVKPLFEDAASRAQQAFDKIHSITAGLDKESAEEIWDYVGRIAPLYKQLSNKYNSTEEIIRGESEESLNALANELEDIEDAVAGEQGEMELNRRDSLIDYYDRVAQEEGFFTKWAMWKDPTGTGDTIDMSSRHPYPEGTVIEYSGPFGRDEPQRVKIEGLQWRNVWQACEKVIRLIDDFRERYIQGLHKKDGEDGVLVIQTGQGY